MTMTPLPQQLQPRLRACQLICKRLRLRLVTREQEAVVDEGKAKEAKGALVKAAAKGKELRLHPKEVRVAATTEKVCQLTLAVVKGMETSWCLRRLSCSCSNGGNHRSNSGTFHHSTSHSGEVRRSSSSSNSNGELHFHRGVTGHQQVTRKGGEVVVAPSNLTTNTHQCRGFGCLLLREPTAWRHLSSRRPARHHSSSSSNILRQ